MTLSATAGTCHVGYLTLGLDISDIIYIHTCVYMYIIIVIFIIVMIILIIMMIILITINAYIGGI